MNFVLEASIALSWCFADEMTSASAKLLDSLDTEMAYVPSHWSLEVGNILVNASRKKRITYAEVSEYLNLFQSINICVDTETESRGFREIISLAHTEKLTTYDAAYLELAMRLGLPLATLDKELAKAAARLGIKIIK